VGSHDAAHGVARLSLYLLDTTVLIAHLRGDVAVTSRLLELLADRHTLGTSCVNVAEIERGIRPKEHKAAGALLTRLRFIETTREAATRAGSYQAAFERRGLTILPLRVARKQSAGVAGLLRRRKARVRDRPVLRLLR
jgi:predicted nucleic acid-binding protein